MKLTDEQLKRVRISRGGLPPVGLEFCGTGFTGFAPASYVSRQFTPIETSINLSEIFPELEEGATQVTIWRDGSGYYFLNGERKALHLSRERWKDLLVLIGYDREALS